jgi:hypothetical protein
MAAIFRDTDKVHALLVQILHRHGVTGSAEYLTVSKVQQGEQRLYKLEANRSVSYIVTNVLSHITGRTLGSRSSLLLYQADVARLEDALKAFEHPRTTTPGGQGTARTRHLVGTRKQRGRRRKTR